MKETKKLNYNEKLFLKTFNKICSESENIEFLKRVTNIANCWHMINFVKAREHKYDLKSNIKHQIYVLKKNLPKGADPLISIGD